MDENLDGKTMIAYLSGAMEHVADEGACWRSDMAQWLKSELGHDVIDPVITSQALVEKNNAQDYRDWKTSDPIRFVEFVRKAINLDLENECLATTIPCSVNRPNLTWFW